MTWAKLKSSGKGRVRYALVVAGWPEIFTSDPSLTLASGTQGRTAITSLLTDGLEFSQRLIPQEGISEGSGMAFRLRSPSRADAVMTSLTDFGVPASELAADLTVAATTATYAGATPSAETRYHIGSEVIRTDTTPTTLSDRGQWGTEAEAHRITYFDRTQPAYIYDRPPTMDGRRVVLYAWGTGDDGSSFSAGTAIWRGVVTQPPMLDSDGGTWIIQADSITSLLNQTVVGHDIEAKIVGYYHHKLAPIVINGWYNGTRSSAYYVEGFYRDHLTLASAINTQLASMVTELTGLSSAISDLSAVYNESRGHWIVRVVTAGATPDFDIDIGSSLIGWAGFTESDAGNWLDSDDRVVAYDDLAASTVYRKELINQADVHLATPAAQARFRGPLVNDDGLAFPAAMLGGPDFAGAWASQLGAPTPSELTASEWRLYVDTDLSTINGQFVMIDGSRAGAPFKVSAAAFDSTAGAHYIEVEPPVRFGGRGTFEAYLGPDSVITPLIEYSDDGFGDFLEAVVTRAAEEGNNGIAPYFQLNDFANNGSVPTFTNHNLPSLKFTQRDYAFHKSVPVRDVISGEMHMLGQILYLTENGQMAFRPMPLFTETTVTTKAVTSAEIITPADNYGGWPGYQIQAQGLVNNISVHEGYMPAEDEWRWRFNLTDANSVASHKSRGRGQLEVRIYSSHGTDDMTFSDASLVAARLFSFMARSYAAITVQVPYTCFDYLIGDVVKLTHPMIPNGSGARGVTNRRAVVIERRWNLDAARSEMGTLTLWMLQEAVAGYCPSAIITSQVNDSGNTWTLTCSSANALNIALSTNNDGKVLEHLSTDNGGDYVEIVRRDDPSPSIYPGRVVSIDQDNDTVTVALSISWTPSILSWVLEFQTDTGSTVTANQDPFTYIADTGRLLTDGSHAKRFA